MGYSARYEEWRYILWLEFDTTTFLPSLHLPPLSEELYDHRNDLKNVSYLGQKETENLAYNNEFSEILLKLRVELYDYLWHTASFEHLFQKRASVKDMRSIVMGRGHNSSHPHHALYHSHHFSHYSSYSKSIKMDSVSLNTFSTISGIINKTERSIEEFAMLNDPSTEFQTTNRKSMRGNKRKRNQLKRIASESYD